MNRLQMAKDIVAGKTPPVESLHPAQRPTGLYYPGLHAKCSYDPSEFPWVVHLLEGFDVIRDELDACLRRRSGFETSFPGFEDQGRWATLWFYLYGQRFEANCAAFPATTALIEQIPRSAGWSALSALAPGSHVHAHYGVTNAKLRLHFAIRADEGSRLRVADSFFDWHEGEILIFDDSFEHEVWVGGERPRVVLIVDFYHPDLEDDEVAFLREFETTPSTFLYGESLRSRVDRARTEFARHPLFRDPDWVYD